MNDGAVLSEAQIREVKGLAEGARKAFGVSMAVPIAGDIRALIERKGIILCEYPFARGKQGRIDAEIAWYETGDGPITFIGLNTSLLRS